MENIIISAVICTHNRMQYVLKAVESLKGQTLDKGKYEIIVVDNHSTDNTAPEIKEISKKEKNVRYLHEENIGLSFARNTGWQNARGKYIAFLDDDALASPDWLAKIVDRFEGLDSKIGALGGRVDPIWEIPPPSWITAGQKRALAIVNWSKSAHMLMEHQWLAGVNIAYKKRILLEFNGFNVSLGRKGKKLLSIEETILREQMDEKNIKSYYDPEIIVKHYIPKNRLTRKWFLKRFFWQGVSEAKYKIMLEDCSFFKRIKMYFIFLTVLVKSGFNGREEEQVVNKKYSNRFNHSFFDVICFISKNFGFIYGLMKKKYD